MVFRQVNDGWSLSDNPQKVNLLLREGPRNSFAGSKPPFSLT
jgi:hypothetical protein